MTNKNQERPRFESWVYKQWGKNALKKRKDSSGDCDLIFKRELGV